MSGKERTIMIIGAGRFQLPAILKAKEMGFKVLALDKDSEAVGSKYADDFEAIDVKDVEGAIKTARKFDVDGVLSIVSELGVYTTAIVAKEMGLPGLKPEAAKAVTNKAVMREILEKKELPSPHFVKAYTKEDVLVAIDKLKLPVVIKPTDNSGSRGVSKIEKMENLEFSFNWAKENARNGELIVENYIEGEEMTVEAISYKGRHEILAMSVKKRIPFPYCVSIDLTYPPPYEEKMLLKVCEVVKKALTALGVDNGASHSEVLMTKDGPFIVEIAGRGGGFGVFSDIIPLVSGVDPVEQCINIAMGFDVDIKAKYQHAAVLRFFTPKHGKIVGISGLEEARKLPGVYMVELEVKVGDILQPIRRDGERPGLIVTYGETRKEAVLNADAAESTVKFHIEENKK